MLSMLKGVLKCAIGALNAVKGVKRANILNGC